MRIAFIVDLFPVLSETFILNQITGLYDRGHTVDIFAIKPENASQIHAEKMHEDVIRYNLLERTYYRIEPSQSKLQRLVKGLSLIVRYLPQESIPLLRSLNFIKYGKDAVSLRMLYKIAPFLGKGLYDIIHCHYGPNGNLAISLRDIGIIRGRIVTSFHGFDVNIIQRYNENYYAELFKKGDLYTTNSNFTKDRIKSMGCNEDKIIRHPVGLELSKFPYTKRDPSPHHQVTILTIARLVEKKGLEYSIKAVADVAKKYPGILYKIVGDGPLRRQLQELIEQLDMANKIRLLGWKTQAEIRQLYTEATIFVLSSVTARNGDREGQGLVLQEAQAMGLPVISTLHNGIPEGVLDGISGFLVPERDIKALTETLEDLIVDPELRLTMGRAGQQFVSEYYDIDKLNDRLVKIYQQLLTGSI